MQHRNEEAREQTRKGCISRRSFPEHSQKDHREERRVDHRKNRLKEIHDVSELARYKGCSDACQHAQDCSYPPDFQIMFVISLLITCNLSLIHISEPTRRTPISY